MESKSKLGFGKEHMPDNKTTLISKANVSNGAYYKQKEMSPLEVRMTISNFKSDLSFIRFLLFIVIFQLLVITYLV